MTILYTLSSVEIGQHFYWTLGEYHIHGQVLINTWIVFSLILGLSIVTTRNLQSLPLGNQNLIEFFVEYIRDIAKTQVGQEYRQWVPFLGTLFFIYFCI